MQSPDNATEDGTLVVDAGDGVLANDSDVDGGTLTAALLTGPAHGSLTFNPDGSFTYTPGIGCGAATDTFTYAVSDGRGGTATATVTITISQPTNQVVGPDADGILRVYGGDGMDRIRVIPGSHRGCGPHSGGGRSPGYLVVNGVRHSLEGVTEVRVWARGGNDVVDLDGLEVNALVVAGDGDDVVTGGSGNDILVGGRGADDITGGAGHDFVAGGEGSDRLAGSAGNDVLVAGGVGCGFGDEDLRELLIAWASGRAASDADDVLDEEAVDTSLDKLTGGSGADLFVISCGDRITDLKCGWTGDTVVLV